MSHRTHNQCTQDTSFFPPLQFIGYCACRTTYPVHCCYEGLLSSMNCVVFNHCWKKISKDRLVSYMYAVCGESCFLCVCRCMNYVTIALSLSLIIWSPGAFCGRSTHVFLMHLCMYNTKFNWSFDYTYSKFIEFLTCIVHSLVC